MRLLINHFHRFQEKDARRQERQYRRARRVNARSSVEHTSRTLIPEREQHDEKRPSIPPSQLLILRHSLFCGVPY